VRDLDSSFDDSSGSSIDVLRLGHLLPITPLWHLLSQTSICCRNIRLLSSQGLTKSERQLERALGDGNALDLKLLLWKSNLPQEQNYRTRTTTDSREGDFLTYPAQIHVFLGIQHGAMWIAYWCARLHLLSTIHWAQNSLLPNPDQSLSADLRPNTHTRILDVVDDICGSVPYMLGDIGPSWEINIGAPGKAIGAFLVVQALHVANSVAFLSTTKRRWIQERLVHIGHARGIKAALECRRSWLHEN
jgi:hypothetical protein